MGCCLVQLFATPQTVAHQAPLSMEFSRHEFWSGLPFLLQGIFPTQGFEPDSPALAGRFFTTEPLGKCSIWWVFYRKFRPCNGNNGKTLLLLHQLEALYPMVCSLCDRAPVTDFQTSGILQVRGAKRKNSAGEGKKTPRRGSIPSQTLAFRSAQWAVTLQSRWVPPRGRCFQSPSWDSGRAQVPRKQLADRGQCDQKARGRGIRAAVVQTWSLTGSRLSTITQIYSGL